MVHMKITQLYGQSCRLLYCKTHPVDYTDSLDNLFCRLLCWMANPVDYYNSLYGHSVGYSTEWAMMTTLTYFVTHSVGYLYSTANLVDFSNSLYCVSCTAHTQIEIDWFWSRIHSPAIQLHLYLFYLPELWLRTKLFSRSCLWNTRYTKVGYAELKFGGKLKVNNLVWQSL